MMRVGTETIAGDIGVDGLGLAITATRGTVIRKATGAETRMPGGK